MFFNKCQGSQTHSSVPPTRKPFFEFFVSDGRTRYKNEHIYTYINFSIKDINEKEEDGNNI